MENLSELFIGFLHFYLLFFGNYEATEMTEFFCLEMTDFRLVQTSRWLNLPSLTRDNRNVCKSTQNYLFKMLNPKWLSFFFILFPIWGDKIIFQIQRQIFIFSSTWDDQIQLKLTWEDQVFTTWLEMAKFTSVRPEMTEYLS